MKTSLKTLLVLSALVSGCAGSTEPFVFRPIGFEYQEVLAIKDAANEWEQKSDGKYRIIIDESCPEDMCSTIKIADTITANNEFCGINVGSKDVPQFNGLCMGYKDDGLGIRHTVSCVNHEDIIQYDVQIQNLRADTEIIDGMGGNPRRTNETNWIDTVRLTALHEFGHVFNKKHDVEPNTIMDPSIAVGVEHLTERDLENNTNDSI